MYTKFFNLRHRPFSRVPTAERAVKYPGIQSCLDRSIDGIRDCMGPVLVVGASGCGKSTLLAMLAAEFTQQLTVVNLNCAAINSRHELIQCLLFELGLPFQSENEGELRLKLIDHLKSPDHCPGGLLLLVDEAHGLPLTVMEELRMITNMVCGEQHQIRLVIAGGRALEEKLGHPVLESFNQRIAVRCYLEPMTRTETMCYVLTQIQDAGRDGREIFSPSALEKLYDITDGVPRVVSHLCDHALKFAEKKNSTQIVSRMVQSAWLDLQQLPDEGQLAVAPSMDSQSGIIEFGNLDDAGPVPCEQLSHDTGQNESKAVNENQAVNEGDNENEAEHQAMNGANSESPNDPVPTEIAGVPVVGLAVESTITADETNRESHGSPSVSDVQPGPVYRTEQPTQQPQQPVDQQPVAEPISHTQPAENVAPSDEMQPSDPAGAAANDGPFLKPYPSVEKTSDFPSQQMAESVDSAASSVPVEPTVTDEVQAAASQYNPLANHGSQEEASDTLDNLMQQLEQLDHQQPGSFTAMNPAEISGDAPSMIELTPQSVDEPASISGSPTEMPSLNVHTVAQDGPDQGDDSGEMANQPEQVTQTTADETPAIDVHNAGSQPADTPPVTPGYDELFGSTFENETIVDQGYSVHATQNHIASSMSSIDVAGLHRLENLEELEPTPADSLPTPAVVADPRATDSDSQMAGSTDQPSSDSPVALAHVSGVVPQEPGSNQTSVINATQQWPPVAPANVTQPIPVRPPGPATDQPIDKPVTAPSVTQTQPMPIPGAVAGDQGQTVSDIRKLNLQPETPQTVPVAQPSSETVADDSDMLIVQNKETVEKVVEPEQVPAEPTSQGQVVRMNYQDLFQQLRNQPNNSQT